MELTLLILLTLFLISLSAFFSASETALFSIPREKLLRLQESLQFPDRCICHLLENGNRTLMTILLGNLAVNISVVNTVSRVLELSYPRSGIWVTFSLSTFLVLLFGEILPKNIAVWQGLPLARKASPVLYAIDKLIGPVTRIFEKVNGLMIAFFHEHLRAPSPYITGEELNFALQDYLNSEVITRDEFTILDRIMTASKVPLFSVFSHRSELVYSDPTQSCADVIREIKNEGAWYSCVNDEKTGFVKGFLFLEDISELAVRKLPALAFVREAPVIPSSWSIVDAAAMLAQGGFKAASVSGEQGDFIGVITLKAAMKRVLVSTTASVTTEIHIAGTGVREFDGLEKLIDIPGWISPFFKKTG